MPDKLTASDPAMLTLQAGMFLLLLLAASLSDLKRREIPDRLQLAIASLTFLSFSPGISGGFLAHCHIFWSPCFLEAARAWEAGISSWRQHRTCAGTAGQPDRFYSGTGEYVPGLWADYCKTAAPWEERKNPFSGGTVSGGWRGRRLFYENWRFDFMKRKLIISLCAIVPVAAMAAFLIRRRCQ